MNEEERNQLEKAYNEAFTLEDTGGKHWELIDLLGRLGYIVNSRDEAIRKADELLHSISYEEERFLDMEDEE